MPPPPRQAGEWFISGSPSFDVSGFYLLPQALRPSRIVGLPGGRFYWWEAEVDYWCREVETTIVGGGWEALQIVGGGERGGRIGGVRGVGRYRDRPWVATE
jgi:hypothetical protein